MNLTADKLVAVSNVAVDSSTFNPILDGYRDTLRISSQRDEPVSVSVQSSNSRGRIVRRFSTWSATGEYVFEWNGLKDGGLALSGTDRVRPIFQDRIGNK